MDKEFWISIAKNDYQVPKEYTLENLTDILLSYLGSTDPELRDDIAYIVYANWLKREMFSSEIIKSHIDKLLSNLNKGIGETESDTVFLRTFSVLLLAEIVHNDNKKSLLAEEQLRVILDKALWYLDAESDPRGHIPGKGWAHALAHTSDLMLVLARSRNVDEIDLWNMLTAISNKMIHSTNYVYIHGEDERVANAVIEILHRNLIPLDQVESWARFLTQPDGSDWKGAYVEEGRNRAFQNTRNLVRSIYLTLVAQQDKFPNHEQLIKLFWNAVANLKPY